MKTTPALFFKSTLDDIFKNFESASLINIEGQLLYSKDQTEFPFITTKLVVFQIVKKYLNPQVGDLFLMNDPENGGFSFENLFFISLITPQLAVVWHKTCQSINFKIPPTPILDKKIKNDFAWKALLDGRMELTEIVLKQMSQMNSLEKSFQDFKEFEQVKNQQVWLKATQSLFDHQLSQKAFGISECFHSWSAQCAIKLTLTVEEKNNLKSLAFDFTNSSPAQTVHAASHIIESALIKKVLNYYNLNGYLSQSVLDRIKIILPPKSIISKAHPMGLYNLELQELILQMAQFVFEDLNSQTRKKRNQFKIKPSLRLMFNDGRNLFWCHLNHLNYDLTDIEKAIDDGQFKFISARRLENKLFFQLVVQGQTMNLSVKSAWPKTVVDEFIKIDDAQLNSAQVEIKPGQIFELSWPLDTSEG